MYYNGIGFIWNTPAFLYNFYVGPMSKTSYKQIEKKKKRLPRYFKFQLGKRHKDSDLVERFGICVYVFCFGVLADFHPSKFAFNLERADEYH